MCGDQTVEDRRSREGDQGGHCSHSPDNVVG